MMGARRSLRQTRRHVLRPLRRLCWDAELVLVLHDGVHARGGVDVVPQETSLDDDQVWLEGVGGRRSGIAEQAGEEDMVFSLDDSFIQRRLIYEGGAHARSE